MKPLNVEDEDLSPDIVNPPPEHTGITAVVHCLLRCDIMDFLCKVTPKSSYHSQWDNLIDASITLAEKHDLINEMENILERSISDMVIRPILFIIFRLFPLRPQYSR